MYSHNTSAGPGHARKISYYDMAKTYHNAGQLVPPPNPVHQSQQMVTQMQLAEHQQQEKARRERIQRSSRKPTDRHIPDELTGVIVGDGAQRYQQLRDAERRLDALMMRKRLDVRDNAQRSYSKREGTLRVWISNTADGQPWQVMEDGSGLNDDGTFDFENDNNSATYRVKIEGRLLEEAKEDSEEVKSMPAPKFSSFFKSITVDFQRNPDLEPDGFAQIGWQKQQPSAHNPTVDLTAKENYFDKLEFERKGDENINVIVNLVRDQRSERYRLSPPLAELLDTNEEDMPGIVQGIWEYARAMKLQEDDDKRTITCDDTLYRIFGQQRIGFPYLPDLLMHHIQPLPPIKLNYTIRVDRAYISPSDSTSASRPTVYDVRVPLPNTLTPVLNKLHNNRTHVEGLRSIVEMDSDIALLVAKINQTNAKRKFLENLSKNPAGFMQRFISSQRRDLEVIMVEATRGGGEDGEHWKKGGEDGVWGSNVAKESVGLWLARSGRF